MEHQVTLAEAIIPVKLDMGQYNAGMQQLKNGLASGGKTVAENMSKALDQKITQLRQHARSLHTVVHALDSVANTIFKYMLAPGAAIGMLGIHKYMQTTDSGAVALNQSITQLKYAYNQLLARIGQVLVEKLKLVDVIYKIRNYINTLDDQKIARMVKWFKIMAEIFIAMKIVTFFGSFVAGAERSAAAVLKLSKMMGLLGVTNAATNISVGASGGGMAGGHGLLGGRGLLGGGGIMSMFKNQTKF